MAGQKRSVVCVMPCLIGCLNDGVTMSDCLSGGRLIGQSVLTLPMPKLLSPKAQECKNV